MTHDSQSAAFFNSEHFISLLQYVHDLGFQYGLENAQSSKGVTSSLTFGPADFSTVIVCSLTLLHLIKHFYILATSYRAWKYCNKLCKWKKE